MRTAVIRIDGSGFRGRVVSIVLAPIEGTMPQAAYQKMEDYLAGPNVAPVVEKRSEVWNRWRY